MNRRYTVKQRRRIAGKTNYNKRIKLLSSKKNLLIFRKLSRILVAQIVKFEPKGDSVIASANSRELEKYGWTLGRKNIPAAYLTGFLIAKKSKSQKGDIIANFGILSPTKGSAKFAFLKGAIDGGLKVIHSPDAFPDEARIKGKHIEAYVAAKKDRLQFSKSHDAKNVSKIFDEVKKKIESI